MILGFCVALEGGGGSLSCPMERCPTCQNPAVRQIIGPLGDCWCELNHHWRPCKHHRDVALIFQENSRDGVVVNPCHLCRKADVLEETRTFKEMQREMKHVEETLRGDDEAKSIRTSLRSWMWTLAEVIEKLEDSV